MQNENLILLEATNISKSFDYKLFENISLSVRQQETVSIIGESGCGKSTLLNILSTLLVPDSGEVIYNNLNLYNCKTKYLTKVRRDHFGIIFQAHYLFRGFTANENLKIGSILSENDIDNKLLEDLKIAHILKQNIGELSGGQQQRLSIARVLIKKPKIIFADEPTGNLDKQTAYEVTKLLFEYVKNNNAALILVTHDKKLADCCDTIYELEDNEFNKIR